MEHTELQYVEMCGYGDELRMPETLKQLGCSKSTTNAKEYGIYESSKAV